MTYPYKIVILGFALFSFLSSRASVFTDTTNNKMVTSINTMGYQVNDFSLYLAGISAIKQDSLDKGIHLLATAVKAVASKKKITRIIPYHELEFFSLIDSLDNGHLSKQDKQLGQAFFKAAFTKPEDLNSNNISTFFKGAPNSIFTRRLKIMLFWFGDDAHLDKELNSLLKDCPTLITANTLKAEELYDQENYKGSVQYATKVITLSPLYAHAYHVRAKSYEHLGDPEKAIIDYNEAIILFPGFVEAEYDRAGALLDLDKYSEALAGYRKVFAINPSYKWTNYNLTRCFKGLNIPDSALYYSARHIKEYPEDGDGYNLRGDIFYRKNDYSSALDLYTRAIHLNPDKSYYYEDRGDAYYYSGQFDEAINDFKKCVELDKSRTYSYDRIGDCYYQKKEYEKAIPYHQAAIKIDPSYKYAYVSLNSNYLKLGNYTAAIEASKKAIAIDSTYSTAIGNLGWTYYCTGNFDACIKFSYKALKFNDKATYAMFNIALATLRKGDFEKAKDLYRSFIAKCKEKGYEISEGAVDDLRDLIQKNIHTEEAKFIIQNIFDKKL